MIIPITLTQMLMIFSLKVAAFIALAIGLYYTIELRLKTEKILPFWLFIEVGVLLLLVYALSDIIEFGSYLLFQDDVTAEKVANVMDWFEMAVLAGAASFLTAAGLLLKSSKIKPL